MKFSPSSYTSFPRFHVSKEQDDVRLSAVIFSSPYPYSLVYILLNTYYTHTSFNSQIKRAPYYGGNTRMDIALDLANNEIFTPQNGNPFL